MISSVLIGANLTTILLSSIATTIAIGLASEENEALAVAIGTVITTVVVLLGSDITPKVVASKYTEKIILRT
jgi:Mg2+/Co2+ transporter CorB